MLSLLFTVVITLLVVGVLLWAVNAMPWIDADLKRVIRIIVIVIVALWLIGVLSGMAPAPTFRFPR